MLAVIAASLTFFIVFWSVWELGQPWIHRGLPAWIGV
jgi:uncharacterized protein (DUF2062 family)